MKRMMFVPGLLAALLVMTANDLTVTVAAQSGSASQSAQSNKRHGRIFAPQELGVLEGPDREAWQKPSQIMDALNIADGSVVADLGAGGGWFTVRLARRVGPQGIVYAEDIQKQMIESIERRMQREGLRNVKTVLGTPTDARLPANTLDAILIVDVFHEVEEPVLLLEKLKDALKATGRLGIVDFKRDGWGPGPPLEERLDEATVIANAQAAGLRLLSQERFLAYQYLLIFGK